MQLLLHLYYYACFITLVFATELIFFAQFSFPFLLQLEIEIAARTLPAGMVNYPPTYDGMSNCAVTATTTTPNAELPPSYVLPAATFNQNVEVQPLLAMNV